MVSVSGLPLCICAAPQAVPSEGCDPGQPVHAAESSPQRHKSEGQDTREGGQSGREPQHSVPYRGAAGQGLLGQKQEECILTDQSAKSTQTASGSVLSAPAVHCDFSGVLMSSLMVLCLSSDTGAKGISTNII